MDTTSQNNENQADKQAKTLGATEETLTSSETNVLVPLLTPALIAKNFELQEEYSRLAVSPFAAFQNPKEAATERARRILKDALAQINFIETEIEKEQNASVLAALNEQLKLNQRMAAENLFALGRFTEAASLEPDAAQKAVYVEYAVAELTPDDEWCEHERWTGFANNRLINNYYREFSFVSEKYGAQIAMLRCAICGFRNATPLPDDLRKMSEIRKEATK